MYPVYVLAILILFIYYLAIHKEIDYYGLLLNILMIQSWIPNYALSFNTPGWSLSVELFFYITFPFLFNHFYKKLPLKKLILPLFICFIISQIVLHVLLNSIFFEGHPSASHNFTYYFPLMHFSEFLIGNLAGLFFLKVIKIKNYDLPIISLIMLTVIVLKINIRISYHNGMLAFLFIPIIILISANNGQITKISNMKLPVFLGEISYSIYILQKPIFLWVNKIMHYLSLDNKIIIFYSATLILIIISGVSYTYFETPLRKRINKKVIITTT
ncbi:acyltransferase [Formosa sp. PL04]|nr:acyltransferase [Formosa sp. PL04]MDW5290749.1 acyltransferase [Formosa sp. PL04]